jgi:hypothetical protein
VRAGVGVGGDGAELGVEGRAGGVGPSEGKEGGEYCSEEEVGNLGESVGARAKQEGKLH